MENNKEYTESRTSVDYLNGNTDGTKYISVDTAIGELCRNFDETDVSDFYPGIKDAIRMWLNNIPVVDVVPVVRCKDCKNLKKYRCSADGMAWQKCKYENCSCEDYDFCSLGERIE